MTLLACHSITRIFRDVSRLAFVLLFTYVFLISAAVVTVLCLLLLFLKPVFPNTYRRISSNLCYTNLCQLAWLSIDYADVRIHIYGEEEVFTKVGRELTLIISNHRGDLDWLATIVLAFRFKFLQGCRVLLKRSLFFIPGYGQLMWLMDQMFLERNARQDPEGTINKYSKFWKEYPFPIQVFLYCEGTRFTETKHLKSVEYAKTKGLPIFKHHLTPKTKGFSHLMKHLHGGDFKAIYDMEVAYRNVSSGFAPTHMDVLLGKTVDVFLYLRRLPLEHLSDSEEQINDVCYKIFQHKDKIYKYYLQHQEFPAPHQALPSVGNLIWLVRAIEAVWIMVLVIFPLCAMFLTFSLKMCLLSIGLFLFGECFNGPYGKIVFCREIFAFIIIFLSAAYSILTCAIIIYLKGKDASIFAKHVKNN